MSNPYKTGLLSQVYGYLTLNKGPAALTEIAETLGVTYHSLYGVISRDIDKEGAIIFTTEGGVRCAALASAVKSDNVNQLILNVMQGADAMTIKEIAKAAGIMEEAAADFVRGQNKLGNIDITPARNQANYKYEWVGQIEASDEVKRLVDELDKDADDYSEVLTELGSDMISKSSKNPDSPIETTASDVFVGHETPTPEIPDQEKLGNGKAVESAYMVVANGEISLHISKENADKIAAQQAKNEPSVFVYEVISVNQVVYEPTTVARDLASLCS